MYEREYYAIFTKPDKFRWWQLFTGSMAHVILITPCEQDSCMMISPSEGGVEVNYYNRSAIALTTEAFKNGADIAWKIVKEYDLNKPRVKFFRTCVGIAKDFLGINKWWIITPAQLYKELTKGDCNG